MEAIYIRRESDKQSIESSTTYFEAKDNESLISDYNDQVKCGIVAVHAQLLYLIALDKVFKKRFGKSPIYMENNIFGLKRKIKLNGDTFEYFE
jgi:hypothetical protein